MKKVTILLFAVIASFYGWAVPYNTLVVDLADNSSVKIVMTDLLKISFDTDNLIVKGSGADITILKSDLVSVTHTQDTDYIGSVVNDSEFEFDNGLVFRNLPVGSNVRVYDMSGKLEVMERAEGDFTLSLDRLSKGSHILSVNGKSYKIFIK